jgi:hypothetical protein
VAAARRPGREGRAVGYIRRPILNAEASAELPMMPLAVQIFAVALALLVWDSGPLLARLV